MLAQTEWRLSFQQLHLRISLAWWKGDTYFYTGRLINVTPNTREELPERIDCASAEKACGIVSELEHFGFAFISTYLLKSHLFRLYWGHIKAALWALSHFTRLSSLQRQHFVLIRMCHLFRETRWGIRFPSMQMTVLYLFLYQLRHYLPTLLLFDPCIELSGFQVSVFFGVFAMANFTTLTGRQCHYMLIMSLPHLIFLSSHFCYFIRSIHNLEVQHSLRIWAQLRKNFGFHSISIWSPIMSNYLFKPASLGLFSIMPLEGYSLLLRTSFQQIREKCSLPKWDFF